MTNTAEPTLTRRSAKYLVVRRIDARARGDMDTVALIDIVLDGATTVNPEALSSWLQRRIGETSRTVAMAILR